MHLKNDIMFKLGVWMTSRRTLRFIYNILDFLMIRRLAQKLALKIAIMEIENEN